MELAMLLVPIGVLALTVPCWFGPVPPLAQRAACGLAGVALAALGLAGLAGADPTDQASIGDLQLVLLALVAVVGGGPVTSAVLGSVDRADGVDDAATVLRGDAWIGALERAAVFGVLAAGMPEGVAVVVAVKGLGRYPELSGGDGGPNRGTAERFIIGSLASLAWAATCAGLAVLSQT